MAGKASGLDIGEPLATEASFKTATLPVGAPVEPIKAPIEPIEAPIEPIEAPLAPIKAQTVCSDT